MKAIVLTHVSSEGPGTLGEVLESEGVKLETIKLYRGDGLPSGTLEFNGVVSMGGPMNVYEEDTYPFLRDETLFLKKVIDANIPVIGVCLGAQMIAKACGARVYRAQEKEIGWCDIGLSEEAGRNPLFKELPTKLKVFQWHGDTFDLPTGSVHLASSSVCVNQAFRYRNAYGLQFHVEVTREMLAEWFEDSDRREDILVEYDAIRGKLDREAEKIYRGFLELLASAG